MNPANTFRAKDRANWWPLIVLALMGLFSAVLAFSAEPTPEGPAPEEDTAGKSDSEAEASPLPTLDERLDALLAETTGNEYSEPQRCLNIRSYRRVQVLSTRYLLFSKGDVYWLNQLKRPCPSLKWNNLPVFQARGTSSHCQNDIFYATSSMDMQQGLDSTGRPRGTYGLCYLGAFEQITAEQAVLLKE